jgi:hypothetical protein
MQTAKLPVFRRRQDGGKGHYHTAAERIKAIPCDSRRNEWGINGTAPLSEFGRALRELGIELIHAHSPQARGLVERMFKTLSGRLAKEMTMRVINTIEEANKYLMSNLSAHNFILP